MSRSAEAAALSSAPNFLSQAKVLARSRNLDMADAYEVLARRDLHLYDCYRYNNLGLGTSPAPRHESACHARAQQAQNGELSSSAAR